jgi:outer membrane protein OmpA-like peptidoglycan-associated protein
MATTLVVIKEWALLHEKEVISILKQTYIANNQMKLYDLWRHKAAECVAKTYNFETPKYWYDMFKGQKGTKDGLDYNVGGTRVFNLADAKQYYGIGLDGNNRYKSVYNQVSTYLTDLNPCGFNEANPEGVIPFDDAVNMYFLTQIKDLDAGTVEKIEYSKNKTDVMASGKWAIQFKLGSSEISGSTGDLETIYNLLIQAEETKVRVIGHTDSTGKPESNLILSKGRANSVVNYLVGRGITKERFQLVDGKGSSQPISKNDAENRRVDISLLK